MEILIDHHSRRPSAIPCAEHLFQGKSPFRPIVSDGHAQVILDRAKDNSTAVGHAGFAHTDSNEVSTGRSNPEIRIIGQDPRDLSIRYTEHSRNLGNSIHWHMA